MSTNLYLMCDECRKRKWLCSHRADGIGLAAQEFALEHASEGVRVSIEDESPRGAPFGHWAGDEWVLAPIDH